MNILSRLIVKQVWKYPKVWEGFVKCCQRTKPQSYSVLLQLPPAQLTSVFERCPEMREPLLQHVHSFTPHQQAHIPASIMTVLEANSKQPEPEAMQPVVLERQVETPIATIAANVTITPVATFTPVATPPVRAEPIPVPLRDPEPALQQYLPSKKEEEEPMEEGETAPACQEETADTTLQVDLPVVEENPTPDPIETVEEPMEEAPTEPSDVTDQLKDVTEEGTTEPETGTGDTE